MEETCFSLFISFYQRGILYFSFLEQKNQNKNSFLKLRTIDPALLNELYLFRKSFEMVNAPLYPLYIIYLGLCLIVRKIKMKNKCWFMNLPLYIRIMIKFWASYFAVHGPTKYQSKIVNRFSI